MNERGCRLKCIDSSGVNERARLVKSFPFTAATKRTRITIAVPAATCFAARIVQAKREADGTGALLFYRLADAFGCLSPVPMVRPPKNCAFRSLELLAAYPLAKTWPA